MLYLIGSPPLSGMIGRCVCRKLRPFDLVTESLNVSDDGRAAMLCPALSPNTFPMSFLMKTFRAHPSPNAKDYTRPSAFPSCSGGSLGRDRVFQPRDQA